MGLASHPAGFQPAVQEYRLSAGEEWSGWQKILFRFAFIFYTLLILPLDAAWYKELFSSKIVFDFFNTLMRLGGYTFVRVESESGRWGLASYSNWGVVFLIAVAGAAIWTFLVRNRERKEYNLLNYWLGVLIRYRIAMGIIVFGFMKFFPVQMPYPGLGSLHTNFGDFSGYKLYWHSVGLVPWYEVFLGVVEVLAGIFMLFRSTIFIGAVLNAAVLYNIAHANHAYDGGVHVYSAVTVLFSLFFLVQYAPSFWRLIVQQKDAGAGIYFPTYRRPWLRWLAYGTKALLIFLLVFVYGYLRYELHYVKKETKEPVTPGLTNAAGFYNVSEFRRNGTTVPYDPLDSLRWHYVVFEKYSTMVYKVNQQKRIPLDNGSRQENDVDRNYELSGIGGGSRFLYYEADTLQRTLTFYDKGKMGTGFRNSRGKNRGKNFKDYRKPDFVLHYLHTNDNRIILQGLDDRKDSIYVVLDKVNKTYPIQVVRKND